MPNVSSFGAQTDNAVVSGTVTDRQMIIPEVPPQGLMSIGPRQSPNYIKEPWNAQTSYVFYDVVKDGAGASYVATKPVVPAGTALANEDYWFKWADPNAQINELNEVVKTFNERIAQNASAITAEVARATAAEQAEEQRATAAEATKAPVNHASEETIYGIGNEVNYGHVRLASDDAPLTSGANDGVAATPKMVSDYVASEKVIKPVEFWGVTTENNAAINTQNLKKAMNDSAAKNITLLFGEGSYALNACPIQNSITIIGANKNKTIIDFSAQGYKAKGFYVPTDATDGNALVHDVTIKNLTISGALPYTDTSTQKPDNLEWSEVASYCALEGSFFNCDISNLIIRKFSTGIMTKQPKFINNTYNYYNKKYGDNRLIRDISICECVYGLFAQQLDFDFCNLRIYYVIGFAFNAKSCTLNNVHVWAYGSSNIAETCRMSNVEIEAALNNTSAALTVAKTVQVSNLFIWNSAYLTGAAIYLNAKDSNLIGSITFGAQYDSWSAISKNLIAGPSGGGATLNINVLIDSNFTSVTTNEPISNCNGVCNIVSKNKISNSNFAKWLTSNGDVIKKISTAETA